MLIAILGSGALAGFGAGVTAFVLGQSFLVALGLYMAVGVATSLGVAYFVATVGTADKRRHENSGFAHQQNAARGYR